MESVQHSRENNLSLGTHTLVGDLERELGSRSASVRSCVGTVLNGAWLELKAFDKGHVTWPKRAELREGVGAYVNVLNMHGVCFAKTREKFN